MVNTQPAHTAPAYHTLMQTQKAMSDFEALTAVTDVLVVGL
jgi:hypothetical protein